jgi:hypothetical protein
MMEKQTADTKIKDKNIESENTIHAKNQREKELFEGTEYTQDNDVKIIKQVRSIVSGSEQVSGKIDVPTFNLAEQIMAEQRKNSAIRRKAPGRKTTTINTQGREERPADPLEQTAGNEEKEYSSIQKEIITRIISEDIERLSRNRGQRGQKSFDSQRL